jgi:hypothetical protein
MCRQSGHLCRFRRVEVSVEREKRLRYLCLVRELLMKLMAAAVSSERPSVQTKSAVLTAYRFSRPSHRATPSTL